MLCDCDCRPDNDVIGSDVGAHLTGDDRPSCDTSALDEAVNLIKEGFRDMKNILTSNQPRFAAVNTSSLCELPVAFRLHIITAGISVLMSFIMISLICFFYSSDFIFLFIFF